MKAEIVYTSTKMVKCEGSEGIYDHPLVYLEIKGQGDNAQISCPYCSKVFKIAKENKSTYIL